MQSSAFPRVAKILMPIDVLFVASMVLNTITNQCAHRGSSSGMADMQFAGFARGIRS